MGGKSRLATIGATAALCVAASVAASAPAWAAMPAKVHARPHKVTVGGETTLKGRGFPANATLSLAECGSTFWLAPANLCLDEGEVTVTTDAKGRFETSFGVGLCPEGEPGRKSTQRVCYVGERVNGEDFGSLVGAAKLVVTYP